MRSILIAVLAMCSVSLAPPAAAENEFYLSLRGAVGDLDGPRFTTTTSLDTFSTTGSSLALGISFDAFRVEIEQQFHTSEDFVGFFFFDDSIDVAATMLAVTWVPFDQSPIRPLLGVGMGPVDVDLGLETCFDVINGCPVSPDTHASQDAMAYQYTIGLAWRPSDTDFELALTYRGLRAPGLGLTTDGGTPYADDALDMSMFTLELTWFWP